MRVGVDNLKKYGINIKHWFFPITGKIFTYLQSNSPYKDLSFVQLILWQISEITKGHQRGHQEDENSNSSCGSCGTRVSITKAHREVSSVALAFLDFSVVQGLLTVQTTCGVECPQPLFYKQVITGNVNNYNQNSKSNLVSACAK